MPTAVFDMLGTFFSLEGLRPRLSALGAPERTLELWFAEALRDFIALSHAGGYAPIQEVLGAALPRTLLQVGLDDVESSRCARVLEGMKALEPAPGAHEACERLTREGWKLLALTHGSESSTRALLARAGLLDAFGAVLSTDDVRTTKPHPSVYAMARPFLEGEAWMVAAHGWDLTGAKRAGMRTAWVSRKEQRWLEVLPPPDIRGPDLAAVALALSTHSY